MQALVLVSIAALELGACIFVALLVVLAPGATLHAVFAIVCYMASRPLALVSTLPASSVPAMPASTLPASPASSTPVVTMPARPMDAVALIRKRRVQRAIVKHSRDAAWCRRFFKYAKLVCLGWLFVYRFPQVAATTHAGKQVGQPVQSATAPTPETPIQVRL